ncbi:MAG: acyl carrier protein [Myxococcales bacterium]
METRVMDEIIDYIVTTWLSGDARGFTEQTDLQASGILDSFSTLALVAFLDEKFEVQLDPADVSTDSFRTVSAVANLVKGKLSGAGT